MRVGELKAEYEKERSVPLQPSMMLQSMKHFPSSIRTEQIPVAVGGCLAKGSFWKGSPTQKVNTDRKEERKK